MIKSLSKPSKAARARIFDGQDDAAASPFRAGDRIGVHQVVVPAEAVAEGARRAIIVAQRIRFTTPAIPSDP